MTESEKPVGIGIVGSGFMGRTYAEVVSKYVEGARLVGVTAGTRAAQLASDYGCKCFGSLKELLAAKNLDAVFIATPHHRHAKEALAAAKAGKHLLIEKPMACTVADCDTIVDACRSQGLRCSIGFSQRTRVCNVKAKELLDSGRIGKIRHIHTYQTVPGGMPNLPAWQSDGRNMGTLFGHGIHNFDMIRWLTGEEIETVYAKCRSTDSDLKTEGTSDVLMTLEDGTTAYFLCSFQLSPPGFPRSQFTVQAICERGLLDIDAYGEARASIEGAPWETIATQPPIDWQGKGFLDPVRLEAYIAHVSDFVSSIVEKRAPTITAWDGRQAVAAALAAYESSRTGRQIVLETSP